MSRDNRRPQFQRPIYQPFINLSEKSPVEVYNERLDRDLADSRLLSPGLPVEEEVVTMSLQDWASLNRPRVSPSTP